MNKLIRDLQLEAFEACQVYEDQYVKTDQVFDVFAQLLLDEVLRVIGNPICPNYAYKAVEHHFGLNK